VLEQAIALSRVDMLLAQKCGLYASDPCMTHTLPKIHPVLMPKAVTTKRNVDSCQYAPDMHVKLQDLAVLDASVITTSRVGAPSYCSSQAVSS
jgi:hypothetical protein